eukprot:263878-Pyramimonas_sp.AAC.2
MPVSSPTGQVRGSKARVSVTGSRRRTVVQSYSSTYCDCPSILKRASEMEGQERVGCVTSDQLSCGISSEECGEYYAFKGLLRQPQPRLLRG